MVIPLGGGFGPEEDCEIPERIKNGPYRCPWWFLVVLFTVTAIGSFVALKVFDGLIALMVGIWAYYLAKDNFKQMSQQCVFSYGLMCTIQAVFELIVLCMALPGRRTTTTTADGPQGAAAHGGPMASPFGAGHTTSSSYTVTTKITPFFSEEAGWHYNLQSSMMIAGVVVFVFGAILCKISYGEYPNSLFADMGESRPMGASPGYGGGGYSSGGGRYVSGGAARPPIQPARAGGGSSGPGAAGMFGGSGQRLGSA